MLGKLNFEGRTSIKEGSLDQWYANHAGRATVEINENYDKRRNCRWKR